MNLSEMHIWFRQYAQQMGMQNVRAILPEQIDILINTSITDVVNQLIRETIDTNTDRVIKDTTNFAQINALGTLYTVDYIDMFPSSAEANAKVMFKFFKENKLNGLMTTKFDTSEGSDFKDKKADLPDYLYLVDLSLNYKTANTASGCKGGKEWDNVSYSENGVVTNYFPVRFIDDMFLSDTLNDFILKNRLRSPIAVVYNNDTDKVIDLYIDKFSTQGKNGTDYSLQNNLLPYKLRMSYIAKPAKVKYNEDQGVNNIDCNLPEYLHVDILKHAVDLYRIAVSGSLHAQQQTEGANNNRNNQ